jgi:hypothetical protein
MSDDIHKPTTPAEPCFPTEIGLEVTMIALGQKAIELALADGFSTSLRLMQRREEMLRTMRWLQTVRPL